MYRVEDRARKLKGKNERMSRTEDWELLICVYVKGCKSGEQRESEVISDKHIEITQLALLSKFATIIAFMIYMCILHNKPFT